MKTLHKFYIDKCDWKNFYCRICGKKIKKGTICIRGYIHQRYIGICLEHFNDEIKDKAMVENL